MSEIIKKKIRKLEESIRLHQKFYYIDHTPKISDFEFDTMFKELQNLENQYPDYVSLNSPTKIIGSDLDNTFEKVKHKVPVLSLDNTYSTLDLIEWAKKLNPKEIYSLEWKVDGASIVLYYVNGELERAVTRGTGGIGDDITENIRTIRNIPLVLPENIDIFVRGEVYMDFLDFFEFNEENGGKYANPRNLTSGSIKQKNSINVASRPLKIAVYDAYFPKNSSFKTHKDLIHYLKKLNFPILIDTEFKSIDQFEKTINKFQKKKEKVGFPTDGLVIKLDNLSLREDLGETSHSPRWARALKFEATQAETTIEDIDFAIGRTGKLTPRARVTPVKLLGTTITYATLHNQDYINEKKIGIGARVKIAKRGEIIPAVEEVIEEPLEIFKLPLICPTCSTKLKKIDESVDLFCSNKSCPARIKNSLIFFCQRKQMDIEGLGERMIEFFFEKSIIKSIPDIYKLKDKKDELETLEGLGKKSVAIILDGIEKSKSKGLKSILPSLGFNDIGHKVTEVLIESGFADIDSILNAVQEENPEEKLLSLFGLGEKTIRSIIQEFSDPLTLKMIQDLRNLGLNFQSEKIKKSNTLIFEGQNWCVTGSFEFFNPREKAMDLVVYFGGKKTTGVTSKTTHLLVGTGGGSKLEKAKQFCVTIYNENDFISLLKNAGFHDFSQYH
jgi:DNA ligase (NAD+)